MAKKCPDGRWSAVNSIYPEDCIEHMNVGMAVVVLLFFMLIVLLTCIWFAAWDWEDRARKDVEYAQLPRYPNYGSTVRDGKRYDVYHVHTVP